MCRRRLGVLLVVCTAVAAPLTVRAQDAPQQPPAEGKAPPRKLPPLRHTEMKVHRLVVSPDGRRIAAAERSGRVVVWDVDSSKPVFEHTGIWDHTDLAFDGDSDWIVIEELKVHRSYDDAATSRFESKTPDGSTRVVAWSLSGDVRIRCWPLVDHFGPSFLLAGVVPALGGIVLEPADPAATLQIAGPRESDEPTDTAIPSRFRRVSGTRDGRLLVLTADRNQVSVVARTDGRTLWSDPPPPDKAEARTRPVWREVFLHEGAGAVLRQGGTKDAQGYAAEWFVASFELETGAERWRISGGSPMIRAVSAGSPHFVLETDKAWVVADGRTGKTVTSIGVRSDAIQAAAFSPDGTWLWMVKGPKATLTASLCPPLPPK